MAIKKKLSGSQYKKIREIKSRGLTPAYSARLIRGVKQGKSQQQARGHQVGEARIRREREREQNEGLSNAEDRSVRNWYQKHFNPTERNDKPTEEDIIEFAQGRGIEAFRQYQKTWNDAKRQYNQELRKGTWVAGRTNVLEILTEQARVRPEGDISWLYYH